MITRKKAPSICTYKINNVAIRTVDKFKYLGVVIDSKLTWNAHVQYVVSASLRKLWLIKHRLKHCTSRTKLAAYTTLIRPLLEYADAVWDPHTKTGVNNIESVQKKALRFIYNIYNRRVSITDLRTRSGLPSLEFRRRLHRLQTLFNIVNKQTKWIPTYTSILIKQEKPDASTAKRLWCHRLKLLLIASRFSSNYSRVECSTARSRLHALGWIICVCRTIFAMKRVHLESPFPIYVNLYMLHFPTQ